MLKNKRGFVALPYYLALVVILFIVGLALTPALSDSIDEFTSGDELNCSSLTLSDQDKANCDGIDIQIFIFLGLIFGVVGLIIAGGLR